MEGGAGVRGGGRLVATHRAALDAAAHQLSQEQLQQKSEESERKHLIDAANAQANEERNDVTRQVADGQQATELETTDRDNATALEIVDKEIAAGKHKSNISNGKGVGGKK